MNLRKRRAKRAGQPLIGVGSLNLRRLRRASTGGSSPSTPTSPPAQSDPLRVQINPATGVASYQSYSAGTTYVVAGSCSVSGGSGAVTVTWHSSSGESGTGASGSCSFHPTGTGTYTGSVGFNATDSAGNSASGSVPINLYLT